MPKCESPISFGQLRGEAALLFTVQNEVIRARVTNYGGILVSLEVSERDGSWQHLVLGFNDVGAYATAKGSFGAILGRNANRIANGRFSLSGETYQLSKNETSATLHGGEIGFSKKIWTPVSSDACHVHLSLVSPNGDQGFPGEVHVDATYRLDNTSLHLTFDARTTAPTPLTLSAHPYFNLDGWSSKDCLDHIIELEADVYLPIDARQIPTGERRSVRGTPFDFTEPRKIGQSIREVDHQLQLSRGYDHYFVLRESNTGTKMAARVRGPIHGHMLELLTTQRGVQFYTGNNLDGSVAGREGLYRQSAGFALEPQGFPNAPNEPAFPSTILYPGQQYHEEIIYRFHIGHTGSPQQEKGITL